jgi:hypothetical protein
MHTGSCLCGAVAFEADPPLRDVIACHCTQCRKTSGHYWAATSAPMDRFRLTRDEGLDWYRSSDSASRGFCRLCGASLFWKPSGESRISIAAGSFGGPTGLRIAEHWFTGSAGDYYRPEGPPPAPTSAPERVKGGCLCSASRFTVPGPIGPVGACHCGQCRKLSGHYSASFDVTDIDWTARDAMGEYVTPKGGVRGFCTRCGSSLWFRLEEALSVEAGAVDQPTGGHLESHIFVASKGDYYELDDGLPTFAKWDDTPSA